MADKKSIAFTSAESQLSQCGDVPVRTGRYETDEEAALYFARQLAGVIDAERLTSEEVNHLVGCTYGQYVKATRLKPCVDAKPFIDEVRRQIEANKELNTQWRSQLAEIQTQRLMREKGKKVS